MVRKSDLTGKPTLMKELNIGLIKEALEKHHQATRVELSAMTQISQPTINLLIKQLVKEEMVVSLGMADSTGGRKAEVFALNNKRSHVAFVIAKENCFEYTIADMELHTEEFAQVEREENQTYLHQLTELIFRMLEKNPDIRSLVVGVPGAVDAAGEVFAIPSIPEWEHVNLQKILEETFSLPVAVMNDINAIAVGYSQSVTPKPQNMVYLHLGRNEIGAGLIVEGRLYPGCKSFAGEVGYMLPEGLFKNEDTGPKTREEQAVLLERIVTGIICILNPELLVIGGGISEELCQKICEKCSGFLPENILPQFVWIESGKAYYRTGLGTAGRELLNQSVRLA